MKNFRKRSMRKPSEKHIFVRLGPVNGQYQTHREGNTTPAKRGIWAIPIQFSSELHFLGGGNGRLDFTKEEQEKLNNLEDLHTKLGTEELLKLNEFKKLDVKHYKSKNFWYDSAYDIHWAYQGTILNKKFKRHYKRIYLKMTDEIWCRFSPVKGVGCEEWYKCSVREFWDRAKKYLTENWSPELYEVFIEM
ncbi:MAG: hypothetical protein WC503_00655 [Candidatus Shapirobacteria bacterium]